MNSAAVPSATTQESAGSSVSMNSIRDQRRRCEADLGDGAQVLARLRVVHLDLRGAEKYREEQRLFIARDGDRCGRGLELDALHPLAGAEVVHPDLGARILVAAHT